MKQLLPPANATFVAASKTITFATTIPSTISHILHVTNITRGVIYYQPQAGPLFTGTYASPVLTFAAATAGHADGDKLEIFYDDNLNTLSVAPNQSVNVSQVAGTTTDTNSGNKSAGTLRVVVATDQPAMTNAQSAKVTDGTNTAVVRQGSSVAAISDAALVVALRPDQPAVKITDGATTASVMPASTVANTTDAALVVALRPDKPEVKITDGSSTATVKAASTPVTATDKALVVAISPNYVTDCNLRSVNASTTISGNGVSGSGVLRVTVASDSTGQIKLAAGSNLAGSFSIDQTTAGLTNAVQAKQYAGVPVSFTVATPDGTVFTLAAGEIGFIQNLHGSIALAVKKGASASTSSFSFILPCGSATDDGRGGSVQIDDWIGAVSVATMSGTGRYIAWKQAP